MNVLSHATDCKFLGGNTFIASNTTYYQFIEQLPNSIRSRYTCSICTITIMVIPNRPNSALSLISLPTQPVGRVTLNTSSLPNVYNNAVQYVLFH